MMMVMINRGKNLFYCRVSKLKTVSALIRYTFSVNVMMIIIIMIIFILLMIIMIIIIIVIQINLGSWVALVNGSACAEKKDAFFHVLQLLLDPRTSQNDSNTTATCIMTEILIGSGPSQPSKLCEFIV